MPHTGRQTIEKKQQTKNNSQSVHYDNNFSSSSLYILERMKTPCTRGLRRFCCVFFTVGFLCVKVTTWYRAYYNKITPLRVWVVLFCFVFLFLKMFETPEKILRVFSQPSKLFWCDYSVYTQFAMSSWSTT